MPGKREEQARKGQPVGYSAGYKIRRRRNYQQQRQGDAPRPQENFQGCFGQHHDVFKFVFFVTRTEPVAQFSTSADSANESQLYAIRHSVEKTLNTATD